MVKKTQQLFGISTIKALTIIGEDVTTLALIDNMTFSQLFPSGLVWAAQVLCGQLCDCALQEVSSNARLGQSWCALFSKKKKKKAKI